MERKEATALGLTHYNTGRPCKHGHITTRRVKDRKCTECELIAKSAYYNKNKEHISKIQKASYERTKGHHLAQKRMYRQTNKGKINALVAARKQHIKQRTPSWVGKKEMWLIKEIYDLASLRTKMTGRQWHVDHIVPLQGKVVSGLHIPENMQVIPAIINIAKKNKFEIEYGQ
jgi:hypothetical protein